MLGSSRAEGPGKWTLGSSYLASFEKTLLTLERCWRCCFAARGKFSQASGKFLEASRTEKAPGKLLRKGKSSKFLEGVLWAVHQAPSTPKSLLRNMCTGESPCRLLKALEIIERLLQTFRMMALEEALEASAMGSSEKDPGKPLETALP